MWNSKQSNGKSWTGAGDGIEKQSKTTQNYKKMPELPYCTIKLLDSYIYYNHTF